MTSAVCGLKSDYELQLFLWNVLITHSVLVTIKDDFNFNYRFYKIRRVDLAPFKTICVKF